MQMLQKIDKSYNNHSIKLKSGDIIQLTLPENRDGGYFWNFKPDLDSNILKIIDIINISPSSSPNLVGGVGKKRWLIGSTKITNTYILGGTGVFSDSLINNIKSVK
ncbi:hypothetical protein D9O40_12930 [Clostridium autoethanogenum]|uniref:Proteinase inhibitor I42 chagasin domain-containing protein n=2 Tax=Clostridium autoethanogenum TaxID=84023 RepID=A0A3M0SJW6_9CLOT|nr:hypothetical protein D9O40_12930 [Clostridium autoethanogenum]